MILTLNIDTCFLIEVYISFLEKLICNLCTVYYNTRKISANKAKLVFSNELLLCHQY